MGRCVINAAEARAEYLKRDYDGSRRKALDAYQSRLGDLPPMPQISAEQFRAAVAALRASDSPLARAFDSNTERPPPRPPFQPRPPVRRPQ